MLATLALLLAAQETTSPTPAPPQGASPGSGDVIVTAQRRTERLQDVPIAVSVIDQKQLVQTGTYNVARLTQLQPSVQFFSSNPRNASINIRGLGAPFGLTNDGIEQGVGLYIDQVYYARPAAASFDFIDIDRIEVLRGPQGTLYGKNTTAGALNITTRPPSFTPEGRIELTGGDYAFFQGKASVSGPIVDDTVAIRLALTGTTREGTLYNPRLNVRENEQKNIGARGALLWKATPSLSLTFEADYNHQDATCCTQLFARVAPTLRAANRQYPALAAAFGYVPPSTDPFARLVDNDTPVSIVQSFGGASLLAEWQVGSGTITSVTAWRYWDWSPSSDRDFIGLPITTVSASPSRQRQTTQEFRYASDASRPLSYVVGLFGYRQVIDAQAIQQQGAAASLWLLGPSAGSNPALLNGLRQSATNRLGNDSVALFGKLTWRLTNRLTLAPGLRLNYDRKDARYNAVVTGGLPNPTAAQAASIASILAPQAYATTFDKKNVSGDVTLSWKPLTDLLAYATYARAFKSAGVNLGGLPTDAAGQPILAAAIVKPESEDHFELGVKSQWLDRRLTVNLDAFDTEISNFQATVTNGALGVLRGYLANARKVRVRGVEAELRAQPVKPLSLYASAALIDGIYKSFPDAPPAIELTGGTIQSVDISGRRLAGLSKFSISFGGEYDVPIPGAAHAYIGLDGSHRSSFSSNATPSVYTDIRGYTLVNLRAGIASDSGWNVFGWVRNAGNTGYFELLSVQPGNSGLIVGQPGDPRTYGVTVSRRFGARG